MAGTTSSGSLRISTSSAVAMATPAPAPIAMPRSACASAGQADGDAWALRLRGCVQQVRRRHRLAAGEAAVLDQVAQRFLADATLIVGDGDGLRDIVRFSLHHAWQCPQTPFDDLPTGGNVEA